MKNEEYDVVLKMCEKQLEKVKREAQTHDDLLFSSGRKLQANKWLAVILTILVIGLNLLQGHLLSAVSITLIAVVFFMLILTLQKYTALSIEWQSIMREKTMWYQYSRNALTEPTELTDREARIFALHCGIDRKPRY